MPSSKRKDEIADSLFKIVDSLPIKNDYGYVEPNDYSAIKR